MLNICYDSKRAKNGHLVSALEWLEQNKEKARNLKFCPLINGKCNPECVCYVEPVVEHLNARNVVISGFCANRMLRKG